MTKERHRFRRACNTQCDGDWNGRLRVAPSIHRSVAALWGNIIRVAKTVGGSEKLVAWRKAVFASGDHTLNFTLTALSVLYLYYLTEHIGMRPALASVVLLVGRFVDAFTDPLMGRLSDHTRWKSGRRRPYFLIACVPFGLTFAALWVPYPIESEGMKFAVYATLYVIHCLTSTVLSVPYAALTPELTLDYHERTSISTYRAIASATATLIAAAGFRPLAAAFGGGPNGYAMAALVAAVWVTLPWFLIYRTTRERPEFQRPSELDFWQGLRVLMAHQSFRALLALFLCSRVTMDLVGAMFVFFFQYWLGRPDDFEWTMALLIVSTVATLPIWLRIAATRDKAPIFIAGVSWWIAVQATMIFVDPTTPAWLVIALGGLAGVGYGVADMMPWAMLGDVIDEDEIATGERREGIYAGFFTFLRKLGGATAVFIAGIVLDIAGFEKGKVQSETVLSTIRILTAVLPGVFLILAIVAARHYPITRAAHARILEQITARSRRA